MTSADLARNGRPFSRTIETDADVAAALAALLAVDPRLAPLAARVGPLPLRRRAGGFEGLASIITSQQISTAAAAAIWARLAAAVDPFTPEKFLAASAETLRTAGLSRAKIETLKAIAETSSGSFDIDALHGLPAEDAIAAMTALKGVGRWTAEIYLLFCVGYPDIIPAGDLALRTAVQEGLGLTIRPDEKALRALAEAWAPWRGIAARLFWAYYRAMRQAKTERRPGAVAGAPAID